MGRLSDSRRQPIAWTILSHYTSFCHGMMLRLRVLAFTVVCGLLGRWDLDVLSSGRGANVV